MKTSNKLFIATILFIIISMITYDFALRAEYLKGTYKSPFYGFEKITAFKGFSTIDNRAANLISVKIQQGNNSGIWVRNNLKDRISISNKGTTLVIDVADKKSPSLSPYENSITIICPWVDQLITSPFSVQKGKDESDYYSSGTITLAGFKQQNLTLNISKAVSLILEKNKIDYLQALVGDSLSDNAQLIINSNNQINFATIKVAGKNSLEIQNPQIVKPDFNIADSAKVILGGRFLNQLNK